MHYEIVRVAMGELGLNEVRPRRPEQYGYSDRKEYNMFTSQ